MLREPHHEPDDEIARQLVGANMFGRGMYPLILRVYGEYAHGRIDRGALCATLVDLQTLQLRRIAVGLSNDRLVARLCRAREAGPDDLPTAIARIMPSDERVRIALKYGPLPHPAYVLGRLAGVVPGVDLEVGHIVPPAPSDAWSGDGVRAWGDYDEDEQNSHRALAETLGNLVLLEEHLAERTADASFPDKRPWYARSAVADTAALGEAPAWSTAALSARTRALTDRVLDLWPRRHGGAIDDDGLTPVLDAVLRRGWPRGWQREFEYVEYRGEHWEVYDARSLFLRIFQRLWADGREHVVAYSSRHGGPVYTGEAWNGRWSPLDDAHSLYLGWDSRYMLTAVQGLLDDAGIASDVFVKYSHIGEAM